MLKTKDRFVAVLIAALVLITSVIPGTQTQVRADGETRYDDLYVEALEVKNAEDFDKTETVRKGTFSKYFTTIPQAGYNDYSYLFNTIMVGEVKFLRYVAKLGDWLEIGDPVCEIEVKVDEIKVAELEDNIAKEEEMLGSYAFTCEELLDKYNRIYTAGGSDAELAKLLYDRLKHSYEEELKKRRESIDAMQSEYDALVMAQKQTVLTSIAPGYVQYLERYTVGQNMEPYSFIGVIFRKDDGRISIDKGSDFLRFGLNVSLVQNDGQERREAEGTVRSSLDASLPASLIGEDNKIVFGEALKEFNPRKDIVLKVEYVHMENALMVKNKAVYNDSGADYVIMNVDGRRTRIYVVVGGANEEDTWIIRGLEEGDVVLIK
ncbi:MAG: hypothetical protein K6F93_07150 [Lachnospiraceae bacterium]|nr:hypothetical protein [Lachnospiraceae bacterium]